MSRKKKPTIRYDIDLPGLAEYLKSKGAKPECPICSKLSWTVPTGDNVLGISLPWGTGDGDMYMRGLTVLPFICNHCHFVKNVALNKDVRAFVSETTIEPDTGQGDE